MKRFELAGIFNDLGPMIASESNKFSYAIAKNRGIIKRELELIGEVDVNNKEYQEYKNKLRESAIEFSRKDDKGKAIIDKKGNFEIEDVVSFEKVSTDLREVYKEVLDQRDKFMKTVFVPEGGWHKIAFSSIPKNVNMEAIIDFIVEDEKMDENEEEVESPDDKQVVPAESE